MFKLIVGGLILVAGFTVDPRYPGSDMSERIGYRMNQTKLNLVGEYKKDFLEDISFDGAWILFYQTSTPMRTYTLPLDGGPGKANQPDVMDDVLRVVERTSGREIARVKTNSFPYRAEFVPGTRQVFYSEHTGPVTVPRVAEKIWNPDTGTISQCLDTSKISIKEKDDIFSVVAAINDQKAVGTIWQRETGDLLVLVTLPDCALKTIGPLSPSDTEGSLAGNAVSISSTNGQIALGLRNGGAVIRKTADLSFVKQISPPSKLRLGERPLYTPDGKFLLLVATNTIGDKPETKRYLLFYDTKNYEIVRQLDITSWSPPNLGNEPFHNSNYIGTATALSPDGSMMAIGFTRERKKAFSTEEQAEVVLYDLTTGAELATASHPAVKRKRDDPFAARISKLIFTPDGKYLLSSTHDTRLWEIQK